MKVVILANPILEKEIRNIIDILEKEGIKYELFDYKIYKEDILLIDLCENCKEIIVIDNLSKVEEIYSSKISTHNMSFIDFLKLCSEKLKIVKGKIRLLLIPKHKTINREYLLRFLR